VARNFEASFRIGENEARVVGFELVRELGRPPTLDVELRFPSDVGAENGLGQTGVLRFGRVGESAHEFAGIVAEVTVIGSPISRSVLEAIGLENGVTHDVRMRVVSRLALAGQIVTAAIYQDKDVKEIVSEALAAAGIRETMQRWQLARSYPKRPYCVQYFESTLDFVSRLLEEEGIFYSTVVEDGEEVVVFADDSTSADQVEGEPSLPYRGDTAFEAPSDCVVRVIERAHVCSGKFVLRDYDFERPQLDLTATAEADAETELERYDYPGLYTEPDRGAALAQVRLEAERAERETLDVVADCPRLAAGRSFTLTETPWDDMGGELLVVRVCHVFGAPARRELESLGVAVPETPDLYVSSVRAIPATVKFRAAQTTPRPTIEGPQTARVVGPPGAVPETIHTDKHGRIKVKFPWDLGPAHDDKASFWIRTTQLQTSGSMVLPRLGWEVVVEFLEGNPDRPVITGKLYNGLHMPPYSLPSGKTRTSFQTSSSPGGGGRNEIRFEDLAGGEEIMIHSQYDQTKATANDKKTTVGNCSSRFVAVDETIEVSGNQTAKITMGSQLTVGADQTVTVGGNRNLEVNAVAGITSAADESISVGGNHFEMDGNPLQALLAIAAETAIAAAQAAAGAAMAQINAAVQSKVDQVMGPINALTAQVEQLGAGMEALRSGDVGAIAGIAAQASGLPMPPGFGGGGAGGGDAGGGGGGDGGAEAGADSYTAQLGIDGAVSSAIETGMNQGAAALGAALGIDSGGGGGSSEANVDGPEGSVSGISAEDRAKGPGHSQHKVDGDYTETTGAVRVQAAITGHNTEVAADMSQTISLAKLQAAWGNVVSTIGGNQQTQALGQIVFSKADSVESSAGAATTMIGGLLYDKVGGGVVIDAGGPATFIAAFHKWEAASSITIKCGASEIVVDGGGIAITSPLVTILAGKIALTKAVTEV
jgi:type VI secretion system secreted protein VgrG